MHELDLSRHSPVLDPALHVWGWEIPVYLFLGGMAAGVMILAALLHRRGGERSAAARWLPFLAPALVTVGMGALFLDLSHKLYVWRFYLAFRWTSPMSWGAWILVVVYPVTLLFGLASSTLLTVLVIPAIYVALRDDAPAQTARTDELVSAP